MEFEYDPAKSTKNLLKHGIDFEEAQSLWEDQNLVRFPIDYGGEKRWGVISHYSGSRWVAVCTTRGDNTRIISVRRATRKEAAFYDKKNNDR